MKMQYLSYLRVLLVYSAFVQIKTFFMMKIKGKNLSVFLLFLIFNMFDKNLFQK